MGWLSPSRDFNRPRSNFILNSYSLHARADLSKAIEGELDREQLAMASKHGMMPRECPAHRRAAAARQLRSISRSARAGTQSPPPAGAVPVVAVRHGSDTVVGGWLRRRSTSCGLER